MMVVVVVKMMLISYNINVCDDYETLMYNI